MVSRREFFKGAGAVAVSAGLVNRVAAASLPEVAVMSGPATQAPPSPSSGRPFNPVVTLNGWSLPWRMNNNVKEFHLVAEPVVREIAPGMKANLWGYNGQSPGPTIEVVEGDSVRIFVTNRLPEATSIHWHGQVLPNGMDGITGLTQSAIPAGKTFVYEFVARRAGTFMYHPHADEMVQMAMGMMGFWVTHPKNPAEHRVDRDYVMLLNAYDIDPGSYTPKVNTMLDFNLWTINSRSFPGVAPMVAKRGERVRIRVGNLTMTNHPMHIHGHSFEVAGTDGGWIPKPARWPEVTVDIAVGQMRAMEFVADAAGDWAFHCHKSHHTMGPMGHQVPTMIGVEQKDIAKKINDLIPDYMTMGENGMEGMSGMHMPLPDNTLPMSDGTGPFGPIGMGGMFTVLKVRDVLARSDYHDPGWYKQPKSSATYEWTGAALPAAPAAPAMGTNQPGVEFNIRKPQSHNH
jgi:FtsP/CotA-like multicopper oxidase with cupredoxin domain